MKFKDVEPGTIFIADNGKLYVKTTGIQNDVENEAVEFCGLCDLYEFESNEEVEVI
jgi:hypothetical protein